MKMKKVCYIWVGFKFFEVYKFFLTWVSAPDQLSYARFLLNSQQLSGKWAVRNKYVGGTACSL